MAWTAPRTWSDGETVTAALLTAQIKDNFTILKQCVSDNGIWRPAIKTHSYTSGQSNAAGGGDTELTNYNVVIPANTLTAAGSGIVISQFWGTGGVSATTTAKVSIDGGTKKVQTWSLGVTASVYYFETHLHLFRRSSTVGVFLGATEYATALATTTGGGIGIIDTATSGAIDWTAALTLRTYAACNTAGGAILYYQHVQAWDLSDNGATV